MHFLGSKTNESRYLSGSRMLNVWFIFRFLLSFLFLAQVGPDGLGPPNNRTQLSCSADVSLMFDVPKRDRMSLITCLCRTVCTFTPGERMLSEKIRHLTAFRSIIRRRAGKKVENMLQIPAITESCKSCDSSLASRSTFCAYSCLQTNCVVHLRCSLGFVCSFRTAICLARVCWTCRSGSHPCILAKRLNRLMGL